MTFGSLFAGIGGIDLGLERAGLTCRWQVERDPYCQRVLCTHWPDSGQWDDIRTFPPAPAEEWEVDLIAGGFPCQDISYAGAGRGLAGERSGLWYEFARVARVLRPRFVLIENVAALLSRGLDQVLGTLAAIGYDAEWHCIPAAALGADHQRDRVFVLADADGERQGELLANEEARAYFAHRSDCDLWGQERNRGDGHFKRLFLDVLRRADACGIQRVADGVPEQLDQLRCFGNAVVPQVAEWIGRRIMAAVEQKRK